MNDKKNQTKVWEEANTIVRESLSKSNLLLHSEVGRKKKYTEDVIIRAWKLILKKNIVRQK